VLLKQLDDAKTSSKWRAYEAGNPLFETREEVYLQPSLKEGLKGMTAYLLHMGQQVDGWCMQ